MILNLVLQKCYTELKLVLRKFHTENQGLQALFNDLMVAAGWEHANV